MKMISIKQIGVLLLLFFACAEVNAQFDIPAQFPGGDKNLKKYVEDNLIYPDDAMEQGIEGRVVMYFLITKTGRPDSIRILRSLFPSCDKEALRIIESMPDWRPGTLNGKPVNIWFTFPVKFDLSAYKAKEVTIADLQWPIFPGGNKALYDYIKQNLHYPPIATDVCTDGRIILRFIVTPSGTIENIEVMRSLHPYFDKMAIEMVKSMPKWIPAKKNGKPVCSYFTLPVSFRKE